MPERNLARLVATMRPAVVPGEFVFVTLPPGAAPPAASCASVREPEGTSHVVPRPDADALGLAYDLVAGWITLTVHSALDAVGLTAAVATALAAEGIACNVIAGRHHDHLLVPLDRLDDALAALRGLSASASASGGDVSP